MGLFDETAKAIPGQDVGDTSTSGLGSLAAKAIQKAVDDGVLNANTVNTPLSDLRSIIVRDPSRVDPSFDISGVRTTTPTRSELLAAVPEFSGFEYDPTQRSYIEDLYTLYGGAVPTVDVAQDTAQIPGAIDTLVDVGGGGGMDQVTGGSLLDAPTSGGLTESGTFGGQPTFTTTPGTTVDSVTGDITNPDGSYGGNIVDEVALTGAAPSGITGDPIDVGIPDNESGFVDPLGTIGGAPVVSQQLQTQGPTTIEGPLSQVTVGTGLSQTEKDKLAGYTPSFETPEQQEGFLQNVLGRAGQTVEGALNELGKVPGAVVDFAKQTVNVFGQKLNVGKTLAAAAINKVAGGPISLVFDALSLLESTPEQSLTRSIVDELKASGKDYGFNMQSGTLNQDPFGRNPVSAFGNYEQTLLDDLTSTGTTKIDLAKKEFAQDYYDKKAGKVAPQEDIGSVPGDITVAGDGIDEFKDTTTFTGPTMADVAGDDGGGQDKGPSGPPSGPGDTSDGGFGNNKGKRGGDPYGGGPGGVQSDIGGGSVSTGGPPSQGGSSGGPPSQGGGGGGGGGCFLKGTQVTMADGSTKAIEQVDLGDKVAKGGKVFATGKFLVENLHDYKGIKVSGSHMVSEDGNWVRVEDSKHGKPLGDDEHTVYVFGSENRRILINGITFTDYFEVNEQDKLLNNEKDFFNNWKNYASKDSQNNVEIINAI